MGEVELGDRVQDIISGSEGIVTGTAEYLYGCRRVQVHPEEIKDDNPVEHFWVDAAQLVVMTKKAIDVNKPGEKKSPGGPRDDAERGADAER